MLSTLLYLGFLLIIAVLLLFVVLIVIKQGIKSWRFLYGKKDINNRQF